jgi:putative hydrolase of the HAD superfamily
MQTIPPWKNIDTVLLDMDGTILDKHFDDYFWEELVPTHFAIKHQLPIEVAKGQLLSKYRTAERTLRWTDIDYWSGQLGLDLCAMKEEIADQVRVHPGVEPFLQFLQLGEKGMMLVTNAHPKTIEIKLRRTPLIPYFMAVLSSSDVGLPKEDIGFWYEAQRRLHFDKTRSLLIDDNEAALQAAQAFGIEHLLFRSNASSRAVNGTSKLFSVLNDFRDIIPHQGNTEDLCHS